MPLILEFIRTALTMFEVELAHESTIGKECLRGVIEMPSEARILVFEGTRS